MNILNLLTKEKDVAGVEISDSVVRIVFLRKKERSRKQTDDEHTDSIHSTTHELIFKEEPIPPNIIENGVVVDISLFGKILKDIWARAGLGTNYAIVAIPDDAIYSRIFSFPKTVDGARLTEAMRLAIAFQLPMKTDDLYLDWEKTSGTKTTNEVLISTIPRTVVQSYVQALDIAGIKTIALESHLQSIARAIRHEAGKPMLITTKTPDGMTVFILKDGILRFSRTLPTHFVATDKREEEIRKIKIAYEAEHGEALAIYKQSDLQLDDHFTQYSIPEPHAKWLIALGATIRAQIPEGDDDLISLLPVGTEEAYAYQKATAFVIFIRNLTISVSLFFILAFAGGYFFMLSLLSNITHTVASLSTTSVSPEVLKKEDLVARVNTLTQTASTLMSDMPLWSAILTEINTRMTSGITITSFTAPSINDRMSITGVTRDRSALNQFRKTFEESPLFAEIDIPLTNIEQREQIPFSMSFRLKDPNALYWK